MLQSTCSTYYPQVILRNLLLTVTDSAIGLKIFSLFAGDISELQLWRLFSSEGVSGQQIRWQLSTSERMTRCWVDNSKVTVAMKMQTQRKAANSCIYWVIQFLLMHNRNTVYLTVRSQVHLLLPLKGLWQQEGIWPYMNTMYAWETVTSQD